MTSIPVRGGSPAVPLPAEPVAFRPCLTTGVALPLSYASLKRPDHADSLSAEPGRAADAFDGGDPATQAIAKALRFEEHFVTCNRDAALTQ